MKKLISFFAFAAVFGMLFTFVACSDDDDKDKGGKEVKASKVKTLTYQDDYGIEAFTFTYREDGKVSKINTVWKEAEGATEYPEEITFDWSVAGKLTVHKGENVYNYEVNASGYVTKELWDAGNYMAYEYDGNGFFTKQTEYWDGTPTVKYVGTVTDGNLVKQASTRSGKPYSKVFSFTTGNNTCNIQQTNFVNSYWKQQSGIFGKASARLADRLTYGNDGESQSTTVIQYTFDSQNRPATISRSGDGWSETETYTYY